MAKKLTVTFSARGYELDSYNHINNAVFLNYFEHARWEYFRELGMYDFLSNQEHLPVVTDVHVRYQREIRLFDVVVIESFCYAESPYLVFQQKIINQTLQMPSARATTKLIFLDRNKTACDIPAEILERI
ncbi:MAG: acyl-CoA thioesterase [Bacteroidota bacterium]